MRRAVVVFVAEAAVAATEHSAALTSACPRLGANIVVCVFKGVRMSKKEGTMASRHFAVVVFRCRADEKEEALKKN
jgi:hypothetical protein